MPVFTNGERKLLFIHIPKSAGSSVERIGRNRGWIESFSVRGHSLRETSYYKATLQHLHAEPLSQIFNFNEFDCIFTIVRNPFDRIKSEYYWQLGQGITSFKVEDWVPMMFQGYRENPFLCDNHIRPQVEFLPDSERFKLLKLEERGAEKAEEIFEHFSAYSNRSSKIKKVLASRKKHEKRSLKTPEVEYAFFKQYEKIVDFYKKDFDELGYEI